ncbi:hypothetical protein [Micromonospora zhanjiangensis]
MDAHLVPGCVQHPRVPFAIAAGGPRGLALAARYAQTWVTIGEAGQPGARPDAEAWALLERQVDALERACADGGGHPPRSAGWST